MKTQKLHRDQTHQVLELVNQKILDADLTIENQNNKIATLKLVQETLLWLSGKGDLPRIPSENSEILHTHYLMPRRRGHKNAFAWCKKVLSAAEAAGIRDGLTSQEIVEEIRRKFKPDLHPEAILPSLRAHILHRHFIKDDEGRVRISETLKKTLGREVLP